MYGPSSISRDFETTKRTGEEKEEWWQHELNSYPTKYIIRIKGNEMLSNKRVTRPAQLLQVQWKSYPQTWKVSL